MPILPNAHNFIINGGTFTENNNVNGLHMLYGFVASGASHDSAERYPPPKCHPETRQAILADILEWIEDFNGTFQAIWLNGPAGAGKSAIAQTVAEECASRNQLAASFFFSRTVPDRNNPDRLVPTLAYQLAINIPGTATRIKEILNKSIEIQLDELVMKPVTDVERTSLLSKVITIDGLDECQGEASQRLILQLVHKLLNAQFPIHILIASRPEPWIRDEFDAPTFSEKCRRITLTTSISANEDIRTVLRDGFCSIHESPRHRHTMKLVPKPWPSSRDIEELVRKSSGQFIYASTVLKYVGDADFMPTQRLKQVLTLTPTYSSAFSELDQLYLQVLLTCPDIKQTMHILGIILTASKAYKVDENPLAASTRLPNLRIIEQLLSLEPGEGYLALRRLHSLIQLPEVDEAANSQVYIQFCHASFPDFLRDQNRSGDYCIDDEGEIHAEITLSCLRIMESPIKSGTQEDLMGWAFAICSWCYHWRNASPSISLISGITKFDIQNNWIKVILAKPDYSTFLPLPWESFLELLAPFLTKPEDDLRSLLGDICMITSNELEHFIGNDDNDSDSDKKYPFAESADSLKAIHSGNIKIRRLVVEALDKCFVQCIEQSPVPRYLLFILALIPRPRNTSTESDYRLPVKLLRLAAQSSHPWGCEKVLSEHGIDLLHLSNINGEELNENYFQWSAEGIFDTVTPFFRRVYDRGYDEWICHTPELFEFLEDSGRSGIYCIDIEMRRHITMHLLSLSAQVLYNEEGYWKNQGPYLDSILYNLNMSFFSDTVLDYISINYFNQMRMIIFEDFEDESSGFPWRIWYFSSERTQ
ncbi:hypothetical protein BDQ12DRAFT_675820 [Crucibulum laeve]|uniref:NACHT domain-containing protein n=1 Tax=Crucibulum laeve TaxID=68775 RepID=A0A5C3MRJ8_9AGAR|nr:hypothetical protein BDQ12DRAFT_675820 [Crucibulum laeve]